MKLFSRPSCVILLALASISPACLSAQDTKGDFESRSVLKTFHLANVGQVSESNDIVTAIRNVVQPRDRIFLATSTNDIVVSAPPDEIAKIGQIISELDRPKRTYRVTYTLAESQNGKRVGIQHFAMMALLGQRVQLKQGDKVPVLTGSYSTDKAAQQSQFTYLDIGINLDTTLDQFANGLRLRSRVEQSSVATEPQAGHPVDDPIVRQSVLEGTSVITPGKPLTLGSIDMVGSDRHVDVEVMVEALP